MYKCNHCNITFSDKNDEGILTFRGKMYCKKCEEPVIEIPDKPIVPGAFQGAQATLISNSDNRITTNNYYGGMPEEQVETKFGTCKRSDARFCKHCQQWVPFTFFNEEKHICSDCEAEQIRKDYDDGQSYFNDGLYDEAAACFLKYLKICPNEEQAKVKTLIGQCYYELKNYREARKYFVVARRENLDSLYYLGLCYFNGYDVPKNLKTAIDYFRDAAQKGHDKSREIIENIDLSAEKGENGLWGYKTVDGTIVIDYQYHDAGKFSEGFARVMNSENKWGYIDKCGNIVLPYRWNFACSFFDGMAKVEDEHDQRFLINKEGTIIKEMCSSCKQWLPLSQFHQGLSICTDCEKKEILASYDKGCQLLKKGLYSEALSAFQSYKSVCPQERQKSLSGYMGQCYFGMKDYTQAFICLENAGDDNAYSLYYQGLCYYKGLGTHRDCIKAMEFFRQSASKGHSKTKYFLEDLELTEEVDANGKWGYTNEDGEVVIPYRWKDADSFFEDLAFVQDFNDLYGFIDKTGQLVIPCQWKDTDAFSEGLAYVQDTSGKYGFIDKSGCVVIPCKWKDAHFFEKGLAKVQDDEDKWYYIDKKGETVWEDVGPLKDGLARARDPQGKYGYIDKDKNVFIPCKWDMAGDFTNGLAKVLDEDRDWKLIDRDGDIIWWNVGSLSEGLMCTSDSDHLYGYLDQDYNVVIPCKWEWAEDFKDGLAKVGDETECCYIDINGETVWEDVGFISEGLISVRNTEGYYGYIDEKWNVVIPCKWVDANDFSEGLAAVNDGHRYGYINKSGVNVIPCKWDWAFSFENGLAKVSEEYDDGEELDSFIDKRGNVVWEDVSLSEGLIRVRDSQGMYGYLDENYNVAIPCQWDKADVFCNGMARVSKRKGNEDSEYIDYLINKSGDVIWEDVGSTSEGLIRVRDSQGMYGYLDENNIIVISCQWVTAKDFCNGLAAVTDAEKVVKFIDKTGSVVLQAVDACCEGVTITKPGVYSEGVMCVKNSEDKLGYIDESNKIAIPCHWTKASMFHHGKAIVVDTNWNRMGIDKSGSIVWKEVGYLQDGLLQVCNTSDKYGYVDRTLIVVIPCKWKWAAPFFGGLASVRDFSDKWGYIDKKGNNVIHCQWKNAWSFQEGRAMVLANDDKYGFIDKNGIYVSPCQWEDANSFNCGLAPVKKKGKNWAFVKEEDKWGYIDKKGIVAISFKWKKAHRFYENLAAVQDFDDKWGYIDTSGKVVIPCQYKEVSDFNIDKEKAYVKDFSGKTFYIKKTCPVKSQRPT